MLQLNLFAPILLALLTVLILQLLMQTPLVPEVHLFVPLQEHEQDYL
jgi:hypothetical protein